MDLSAYFSWFRRTVCLISHHTLKNMNETKRRNAPYRYMLDNRKERCLWWIKEWIQKRQRAYKIYSQSFFVCVCLVVLLRSMSLDRIEANGCETFLKLTALYIESTINSTELFRGITCSVTGVAAFTNDIKRIFLIFSVLCTQYGFSRICATPWRVNDEWKMNRISKGV